jgi:enamine deaminase RidA (YjgF/YER057c/UK114 family)
LTTITKTASESLDAVEVSRPCFKKFYITAHPTAGDDPCQMFANLARFLHEHKAGIVSQDVFGSCDLYEEGMRALEDTCGEIEWPVTWIEGEGRLARTLTGTQVYAVSGTSVEPIRLDGRIVGSMFEDEDARYCLLGGLCPSGISHSDTEQAREVFEKMESVLGIAGFSFSDVVRTWLYINKILGWYDELNAVRNDFYAERRVSERMMPASTGVGAGNCTGAAVVAEALAIKPKKRNIEIREIRSPLQCPASEYKSSFSRAVEVVLPDHRRLYVSGTASIEPAGKTAHVGDVEKQIALTMDVVEAILGSRQMGWSDVSRAIAYFKDIQDAPLLDRFCKGNRLPALPMAVAHGDICRDELLFEIEVDAVTV